MYDFIVVGGGINGLQIAALLAYEGQKVLLLEKTEHVGGRAFVWEKDGFKVDYGLHLIRFGPESAIARTFRKMGYEIQFNKLGTSYLYEDGKKMIFPTSPAQFLRTDIMSWVEKIKAVPLLLKLKRLKDQWKDLLHMPVSQWMKDNNITGGLRKYFELVTGSMLVCPFMDIASAGELLFNMSQVLKTGKSVMYPRGGWAPLFNFLQTTINKNGEIRIRSKVTGVEIEKDSARGVYLGDEFIEGKNIIINLPVQQLWNVLDKSKFPEEYVERTSKLIPTAGVSIDIGLKKQVAKEKGLLYFYKPMAFGMFTSNIDNSTVPKGKQLLTFFYPTSVEDMKNKELRKKREDEIVEAVFATWDIEANLEWKRVLHLTMVDGAQINIRQTRELRPGYKLPGVKNVFLIGDSLGAPGAGGDVGHESVHGVYRTITGREI